LLLLVWGEVYPPGTSGDARSQGSLKGLLDRDAALMLFISGVVQLGYDLFQFYIPIYAHAQGISASAIGAILATLAIGSVVVRLFLARLVKRYPGRTLLQVVFATGTIGFALIPFSSSALALALIALVFGLGMGIGIPLTVILMFANAATGRSGQTLGLRLTANNLVRFGGPIVFGAVGSALGVAAVFWIVAAIMAGGGALSRQWRGKSH
jgi:predicted MFS family arabinose efflux permease